MTLRVAVILACAGAAGHAANPTQPAISPNGVVNAASYLAPGFSNAGIARGSIFSIFGQYLGPDTPVKAESFPLPTSDGLGATRVHINSGAYSEDIPLVYTSPGQVIAIMPSNVPEGDATLTLAFRTLTSNPALIHVVRSSFGMFTLNQGGTGQAIVQNFVNSAPLPVNTILAPAAPGQVAILWGTGLGPVNGNEAAGPTPGELPYLDALYVGGQRANVRFAGRSSCCVGLDQINFDVPASVTGCYVPVAAVVNGLVSNVGTIAVGSGQRCDDPLSFRTGDLATLASTGRLRIGSIELWNLPSSLNETINGSFAKYSSANLQAAPVPLHASAGSCYETETFLNPGAQVPTYSDPMNAGASFNLNGPPGLQQVINVSPGAYTLSTASPGTYPGSYALTSAGGADIGPLQGTFTVGAPLQWTNAAAFTAAAIPVGQPLTFTWTPGGSSTYVEISIRAAGATLDTSIVCNLLSTAGSFTVPDYLTRTIVAGSVSVSLSSFTMQPAFTAQNLDAGIVTAGTRTTVQATFRN